MLSKIYGEAMSHQSKLPVTIFRPHNLYGPRMGLSHVIPEQLKKSHFALENEKIEVYNPDHMRSFCYIDDAIEIIVGMLENDSCINQVLNLGVEDEEVTIRHLAELCHSITGANISMAFNNEDKGSPIRRAPDMKLTTKLTGIEPLISLKDGIERTYDWYRDNVFEGNVKSAK